MEDSVAAPQTSTGRVLKSDSARERSLSEDRKQFIEEEYDVQNNIIMGHKIVSW